jgi:hypothetical protein
LGGDAERTGAKIGPKLAELCPENGLKSAKDGLFCFGRLFAIVHSDLPHKLASPFLPGRPDNTRYIGKNGLLRAYLCGPAESASTSVSRPSDSVRRARGAALAGGCASHFGPAASHKRAKNA